MTEMVEIHTFGHSTTSIGEARRFVSGCLRSCEPEVVSSVALMVSELVSNVILHSQGSFTVSVEITIETIRIEVSDFGSGTPTLRSPSSSDPSGRGLQIVAQLADDWGIISNTDGNTVWVVVEPTRDDCKSKKVS